MGKRILVTGATDGIGKQTALELAEKGHEIILHGRDKEKLARVKDEIASAAPDSNLHNIMADFSTLENVKRMGDEMNDRFDSLDVLINNAGVYMKEYRESPDGYEMTFAVNHLATFTITLKLIDLLTKGEGRIVTVASAAHSSTLPNFDNLNLKGKFQPYEAYAQSKLCNIMFTYELDEKLSEKGITANCLHPGAINTKLLKAGFGGGGAPVEQGAETPVYLAVSDEVKNTSGKYYINSHINGSSDVSYNKDARKELWEFSARVCGLDL